MIDPYYKTEEERGFYAIEMPRTNFLSTDEKHIFYTHCRWDELYQEKAVLWIGKMQSINPERSPLMERIHRMTIHQGFTSFYAFNLFSLRLQHERLLHLAMENASSVNLRVLNRVLSQNDVVQKVIIHWEDVSVFNSVAYDMLTLIESYGHEVYCMGKDRAYNPSSLFSIPIYSTPIKFFDG
jgi:hypothetical protein